MIAAFLLTFAFQAAVTWLVTPLTWTWPTPVALPVFALTHGLCVAVALILLMPRAGDRPARLIPDGDRLVAPIVPRFRLALPILLGCIAGQTLPIDRAPNTNHNHFDTDPTTLAISLAMLLFCAALFLAYLRGAPPSLILDHTGLTLHGFRDRTYRWTDLTPNDPPNPPPGTRELTLHRRDGAKPIKLTLNHLNVDIPFLATTLRTYTTQPNAELPPDMS